MPESMQIKGLLRGSYYIDSNHINIPLCYCEPLGHIARCHYYKEKQDEGPVSETAPQDG